MFALDKNNSDVCYNYAYLLAARLSGWRSAKEGLLTELRKLVESRSKGRRWAYVLCAAVALFLALWDARDGFVGTLPYLLVFTLSVVQFRRPVLLSWFVLITLFLAYTIFVAVNFPTKSLREFAVFFLIGFIPTLALLWARPKSNAVPQGGHLWPTM